MSWVIQTNDDIVQRSLDLEQVYVAAYEHSATSVKIDKSISGTKNISIESKSWGYGYDCGGGDTQTMLENSKGLFGVDIYSFIGDYSFNSLYVCVGYQSTSDFTIITANPTQKPTSSPTPPTLSMYSLWSAFITLIYNNSPNTYIKKKKIQNDKITK